MYLKRIIKLREAPPCSGELHLTLNFFFNLVKQPLVLAAEQFEHLGFLAEEIVIHFLYHVNITG